MSKNYFHYNLKKLRRDIGLSQEDLSHKLGVGRTRLSRIENYKERLSAKQVENLKSSFANYEDYRIIEFEEESTENILQIQDLKKQIQTLKDILALKDEIIQSKNDQIDLLKKPSGSLYSRGETPISYSTLKPSGKFVNWNSVDIPSDKYFEIVPGIYDRVIHAKDHFIHEWEVIFKKALSDIDFNKYKVILNHSKKGSIFKMHYHVEPETLICVSGSFHEELTNKTIQEGEFIEFASMQPHEVTTLEQSYLIIMIEKRN